MTFEQYYVDLNGKDGHAALLDQLGKVGFATFDGIGGSSDLLGIVPLLGDVSPHRDADEAGVTRIRSTEVAASDPDGLLGFGGFSSRGQQPHTDRSDIRDTPDFILLSCAVPANVGGESIFVDGRALYHRIADRDPELLVMLEKPSSVIFGAPISRYDGSVFARGSDGRVSIRYRADALGYYSAPLAAAFGHLAGHIEALTIYISLAQGQGYCLSNTAWLHGRSQYSGPREMHRVLIRAPEKVPVPLGRGFVL